MKKYQIYLILATIGVVIYHEYSLTKKVDEIHDVVLPYILDTVNDTNDTVNEISRTIHNTPFDLSNEYHCLASNIYWESRNQSLNGKVAVGQVVLNRVDSSDYPDTICNVVKQTKYYPSGGIDLHDCQFSWYCDGKSDIPLEHEQKAYEESFMIAVNLLENRPMDLTGGAVHYHSDKVYPYWADSLKRTTRIDNHIFYKRK